MAYPDKPLSGMTTDELAQLSPETFKALADNHNDGLELRENARNRQDEQYREGITAEVDEALAELVMETRANAKERPSLVHRIVEKVKQAPENIRARRTDFSGLLQYEDDHDERENTLRDDRW